MLQDYAQDLDQFFQINQQAQYRRQSSELMPIQLQKYQKYNQFELRPTMLKHWLVIIMMVFLTCPVSTIFCSSTCIDYDRACFDETPQGCWVCANHIFNINANFSSSTPCTPLNQSTIIANQLSNTAAMSLYGYSSSNPNPVTCTNYSFSGQYTANSYLSKTFNDIPLNHYAVVVRFNVGYLGSWSTLDGLRLKLQDQHQAINYDYYYSCDTAENICGQTYNTTDCIRIRQYTMQHNTSSLSLNFTSLISQTNSSIQWWGIKELLVSAKLCHPYCLTCFGASNSNCLSCASSYYLQGNVCLPTCDNALFTVPQKSICVSICPEGFYPFLNSTTQVKTCLKCQSGCLLCSGPDICQAWADTQAYVPNLWNDKIEFWILLILAISALLFFAIYKIIKKTAPVNSELDEKLNKSDDKKSDDKQNSAQMKSSKSDKDHTKKTAFDKNYSNINSLKSEAKLGNDSMVDSIAHPEYKGESTLWFNELVQMETNEIKVARGRKRRRSPKEEIKQQGDIEITSKAQGL